MHIVFNCSATSPFLFFCTNGLSIDIWENILKIGFYNGFFYTVLVWGYGFTSIRGVWSARQS